MIHQGTEIVNPKASFDECYRRYSPQLYSSLLLKGLNYRLPFEAMQLFRDYLDSLVLPNDLKVTFLGSGHGLESAALKYRYTCDDILQHWLNDDPHKHVFSSADPRFKVTMIDINEPPLQFAYDVGLCDRFFVCDLTKEFPEEIDVILNNETDLLVCVGATTYIGLDSFNRLVQIVERSNIQYFCFSLASFISSSYLIALNQSNLQLHSLGQIKQRDYKDDVEKTRILESLIMENNCSAEDNYGLTTSVFIAQKRG